VVALVVGIVTFSFWWQARLNSHVDLGRKLIGRWAVDGKSDGLMAGAPAALDGSVKRAPGRHGTAWLFDGVSANVSVTNSPELAFGSGQDFSVMAWIQPQRSQTAFNVMSIVEKRKVGASPPPEVIRCTSMMAG